jgi:hypothetical protein
VRQVGVVKIYDAKQNKKKCAGNCLWCLCVELHQQKKKNSLGKKIELEFTYACLRHLKNCYVCLNAQSNYFYCMNNNALIKQLHCSHYVKSEKNRVGN